MIPCSSQKAKAYLHNPPPVMDGAWALARASDLVLWVIPSMADGQGRALDSGSTPDAPLDYFFRAFSSSEAPAVTVGYFLFLQFGV